MVDKIICRCPFCGDSEKHPTKGHLTIYLSSLSFYCFRCRISGELSIRDAMQLLSLMPSDGEGIFNGGVTPGLRFHAVPEAFTPARGLATEPPSAWKTLIRPGSRLSYVHQRWQTEQFDIFEVRNRANERTGFHLRGLTEKKIYTVGKVSLGIPKGRIDPKKIYHLVEGPYDVVRDDFICTYGIPTASQVQELRLLSLVLIPDGDVWSRPDLFLKWVKPFLSMRNMVEAVWRLPVGLDIDEVKEEDWYYAIQRYDFDAVAKTYYRLLANNKGAAPVRAAPVNRIALHLS